MKITINGMTATASNRTEEEDKKFKALFEKLQKAAKERNTHEADFRAAITKLFAEFDKKQATINDNGYKIAAEIDDLVEETDSELLETQEELVALFMESTAPRTAQFMLPRKLIGLRLASNERADR